MFVGRPPWLCMLAALCAVSCAYPRRSTPLNQLPSAPQNGAVGPDGLWKLELVAIDVPPTKRGGHPWDPPEEGEVDPYVKLLSGTTLVWQSEPVPDAAHPRPHQSPKLNVALEKGQKLAIELWDEDGLTGSDLIGIYKGKALTEGFVVDADILVKFEGGATATFRLHPPEPHLGVGIETYEVHRDALHVVRVLPYSPAARAGLTAGDAIVAIDDHSVRELGEHKASSWLAMASQRQSRLRVKRGDRFREVQLDRGYVWLSQ